MKQLVVIIIGLIFSGGMLQAQPDTIPIRLSGRVFSTDSLQPAPYVHVINLASGKGTVANQDGLFKTLALSGDSLLFKCMGFDDAIFVVPQNLPSKIAHFDIRLSPGNIALEVIDVIALTRQNQFKHDFTNLPPDKNAWENQIIIPGVTRKNYEWIRKEEQYKPKATFDGPVSALYYAFRKEGKSLRKLAELINNEENRRVIDSKYNMQLLGEFTGYTGDKLIAFFVHLHFTDSYILNTNLYSIYTEISWQIKPFESKYNTRQE